MKRMISVLILSALCLTLCACGGKTGEIGETYTSNDIEFTLNYVEFTDVMDNWGGANDTYWMPLPADATGHYLENAVSPKSSDDTICVISYTAKNVAKYDKTIDDCGTLDYDNGYSYSDGGLAVRLTPTGVWNEIPNGIVLKQLKEDTYEFRAYMVVPKALVENTDKPLTYTLFEVEYDLR